MVLLSCTTFVIKILLVGTPQYKLKRAQITHLLACQLPYYNSVSRKSFHVILRKLCDERIYVAKVESIYT